MNTVATVDLEISTRRENEAESVLCCGAKAAGSEGLGGVEVSPDWSGAPFDKTGSGCFMGWRALVNSTVQAL
jgi:hypothetical protein